MFCLFSESSANLFVCSLFSPSVAHLPLPSPAWNCCGASTLTMECVATCLTASEVNTLLGLQHWPTIKIHLVLDYKNSYLVCISDLIWMYIIINPKVIIKYTNGAYVNIVRIWGHSDFGRDMTSYLSPQRSQAPSFWTPTGSLATLKRLPSMRSRCKQEIWWKLWRKVQMVRNGRSFQLTLSCPAWLHLLLEWSFVCLQAGGSASVIPAWAGYQPPTLSLWTPQRSLRKPNPTTQASDLAAGSDNGGPKHKTCIDFF